MNRSSEGGWEAYHCDRFAVGAEIPDPHTSPVGDSPNALHTYILYFYTIYQIYHIYTNNYAICYKCEILQGIPMLS